MGDSRRLRADAPVTFRSRDPIVDAFQALDGYLGRPAVAPAAGGPAGAGLVGMGPRDVEAGPHPHAPRPGAGSQAAAPGPDTPARLLNLPPFLGDTARADLFCSAILADDDGIVRRLLLPGLDQGWSPDLIAEEVVPAAAGRLGEWWQESRASFAEVAVGCARLHEMLRLLRDQADVRPDAARRAAGPSAAGGDVLLLTPETDHHSLAASVVAYRFRRLGVGVRLLAGMSPRQVVPLLQGRAYGAVAISVGCRQSLLQSRALIAMIRSAVPRPVPVVIGGPVLDLDIEMVRKTGADFASNDAAEALDFCGIAPMSEKVVE
jgi:methanogenic corrinoid protein MtbC1